VALKYKKITKLVRSCDEDTPEGLQKKTFLVFSFELAWRGGEGSKCLLSYFAEGTNNSGEKTERIEYNPVFTKTTQGEGPCASSKWLIIKKVNPDMCPIRLYKKFLEKRKGIMTDRFFLTVNPTWAMNRKWYKNIPTGRNTVAKWTKSQADKIGLTKKDAKLTNHSLRATAV